MTPRIASFGMSDTGLLRRNNEDSYLVDDSMGLYLVADGMGGHAAGEVASRMAAEEVRGFLQRHCNARKPSWPFPTPKQYPLLWQCMIASIMSANGRIYRQSRQDKSLAGMGTTVVALLVKGSEAIFAHVGDSRLYLYREGRLTLKTEDHSWIQEQINAGNLTMEEAERHPLRNVITRALGGASVVSVDIGSLAMRPGDLLLLCTDGLTTMVGDDAIAEALNSQQDLPSAANKLINSANERGGHDNTSVVLIRRMD